ncbi:hypothetical protein [Metasolibacillus meyeri]|uniref:hypothetical protein n=1 Tax=Metasolibacillus meyeri TaxID=1071052 RepID=UPI000D31FDFD|nr:hypothetical protein [Metasolibacillus meyeri]
MSSVRVKKILGLATLVGFFFLIASGNVLATSDSEVKHLVENTFNRIYVTCLVSLLLNFILILFQIKRKKEKINSYQAILSLINSLVCIYLSVFVYWKEAVYIDFTNSNGNSSHLILILINIVLGCLILIFNFIYKNKGDRNDEN